jgi:valyl-tRNA synthetase
VPPGRKAKLYIETPTPEAFSGAAPFLERLAAASDVTIQSEPFHLQNCVTAVTSSAKVLIPLGDLVDLAAEKNRLQKEIATAEKLLAGVESKLGNTAFVAKAPQAIVEQQRQTQAKLQAQLSGLIETLNKLST